MKRACSRSVSDGKKVVVTVSSSLSIAPHEYLLRNTVCRDFNHSDFGIITLDALQLFLRHVTNNPFFSMVIKSTQALT